MTRRKVKNGEKSPWGQCLTRPVPNGRRRSDFWLVPENFCVFLPNQKSERRRPFGTGLVRNCPQGLFWPFCTFLSATFIRPFRLSLAPTICPWRETCVSKSIGLAFIVGSKFTVFALFYFVFEGNFPSTSPRGAHILRGDLTEGFLCNRFGGLIFGGAYT